MSPKSRPPERGKGGKKGRKGKKGRQASDASEVRYQEIVEERGVPFGLVVLIAVVMTLPSLTGFFDGTMEFRPVIVRLLAALLVAWLLCQLVYSVIKSFGKEETTVVTENVEERPADYGYGDDPYGQDRPAS